MATASGSGRSPTGHAHSGWRLKAIAAPGWLGPAVNTCFNRFAQAGQVIVIVDRATIKPLHMNTWIGTSGFQYTEWKGNFYPEDLPTAKMLPYYAERLTTTEINYTFHRIPAPKTIDNWIKLTPEKFRFALKAPQKITHWSKLRDCADTMRYFHDVTSGLGVKLGPVLFQLPPTFKKDVIVLADFVNCLPTGAKAAFEFRHESWFGDDVWQVLQSRDVALCIAETEDFSTPKEITAGYGYLRLRREDYTSADVQRWTAFIQEHRERWSDAFVYFKHEEAGIGPKLATEMVGLMT